MSSTKKMLLSILMNSVGTARSMVVPVASQRPIADMETLREQTPHSRGFSAGIIVFES